MSVSTSREPDRIAGMFDAIAWRYDRLNHLLSAGLDRWWRARAIRWLAFRGHERVYDVCTGTGDLAIEALRSRAGAAREVVGIDFAGEMLKLAVRKADRLQLGSRARFVRGDATRLPCPDGSGDAVTVGFGIRNVVDYEAACREFYRVLRPGGRLAILEFGMPRIPGIQGLYRAYFTQVLPRVGGLVSKHGEAYSYLPASVESFPRPDQFVTMLRQIGFSSVRAVRFSFGIVYFYTAVR